MFWSASTVDEGILTYFEAFSPKLQTGIHTIATDIRILNTNFKYSILQTIWY